MNGKEYADTIREYAGQIQGMLSIDVPHLEGCQAHAVTRQISEIHAKKMITDANYFGNGFTEDIADKTAAKLAVMVAELEVRLKDGIVVKSDPVWAQIGKLGITPTLLFRAFLAIISSLILLVQAMKTEKADPAIVKEITKIAAEQTLVAHELKEEKRGADQTEKRVEVEIKP